MNTLVKVVLLSALLALPSCASAQSEAAPKSASSMNCPMMANSSAMQKDMGSMMTDMDAMAAGMSDPAMKARMQKMHDQMGTMMANMQKMGGGMGMMRGKMQSEPDKTAAPKATPPATPEDHKAHHPKE